VTEPATEPAPDLPRVPPRLTTAFLVLASLFFGLAIADRLLAIAGSFSSILQTIFLAWLLAFIVAPTVDLTQERLRIGRGRAIVLVYLGVLASVVGFVAATAAIGAPEAADILARSDEITARVHEVLVSAQTVLGLNPSVIDLATTFDAAQKAFFSTIGGTLSDQIQATASTAFAVMGSLFLIVILSLYAVIDFDGILGGLRRVVPNRYSD
jgi:predicted PurR-regulated permease PerM